MPKYDFECQACDTVVEMRVAFDSVERPKCDTCGAPMVKVYTPPSVHFKGGGWGGK